MCLKVKSSFCLFKSVCASIEVIRHFTGMNSFEPSSENSEEEIRSLLVHIGLIIVLLVIVLVIYSWIKRTIVVDGKNDASIDQV